MVVHGGDAVVTDGDTARTTFTLPEAAALLQVHPETLRRAIKAGQLMAAKIGKEYRISKTDLEAYWTAKGGGALFDDSPRPEGRMLGRGRKKRDARGGAEQLNLLHQPTAGTAANEAPMDGTATVPGDDGEQ